MAKLQVGALNIKTHPNSPENYVNLFQDLFRFRPATKIWGSDFGTPKNIYEHETGKPEEGLFGTFYKFMKIDPNSPWLDLEKNQTLVDEKGNPIPQIRDNLAPNTKEIEFIFFPKGHRMFFNTKYMSPNRAKMMMEGLFSREDFRKKYGEVDIEVESSSEVIEKILKIPTLTKLNIRFTKPNGDELHEEEEKVLKRFNKQNIRRYKEELGSDKNGDGIKPDKETLALMNLATSNGMVYAEGYAGESKVVESTDPHPLIETTSYDPNKGTFFSILYQVSSDVLRRILNRRH